MAHRFTRTCLVDGRKYEAGCRIPDAMSESTVDYLVSTGRAELISDDPPPADEPTRIDEEDEGASEVPDEETVETGGETESGDEPAEDASTPLAEVAGLQDDHREKLAAVGITTLGEYDAHVASEPLTTIDGIGKATSTAIVGAVDAHRGDDDGPDA